MVWVHGVLAVLCLLIGGWHLAGFALRRGDPVEASYAAMGLGMAGMFSPIGDPVPATLWTAVFLVCGGWFGGLLLGARSLRILDGEAAHFVIGSAAMLFMLGLGHRGGHLEGIRPAGVTSAVALVFAAYFVLHTMRCADRWTVARLGAAEPAPAAELEGGAGRRTALAVRVPAVLRCSSRIGALAHLVMTVAMAVMLVPMI